MALIANRMRLSTYTKPESSKAVLQATISIMAKSLAISMDQSPSMQTAN
jgi:hypothetical protein